MIQNVFVIRFSLRIGDWPTRAYGAERNRERWFAHRAALFNASTLPSLLAQTVRPSKIFLLMDQTDRDLFHRYIPGGEGLIVPIFAKNRDHFRQVSAILKQGDVRHLAISRIDSDDIVAKDYLSAVNATIRQARRNKTTFSFVVAPNGYRTNYAKIQDLQYLNSPFLTLFAPIYRGQNVFRIKHVDVGSESHVLCDGARWIQVIHGGNLANDFTHSSATRAVKNELPQGFPSLNLFDLAAMVGARDRVRPAVLLRRVWRSLKVPVWRALIEARAKLRGPGKGDNSSG